MNITYKIMRKIVQSKLINCIHLEEEQRGFRNGRSCTDAIVITQQVPEKPIKFKKSAIMYLVDLRKAFESDYQAF